MASDDAQLITALTKRLKTSGSKYDPVEAHVVVAVGLARGDPSVATGTVCKSAGIPKGRFHKQIDEWRKRIVAENLLVECSRAAVGGGTDGEPTDAAATAHSAADSIDSSSPNAIAYDNDAARDKERLARRARAERERYAAAKAVRETLESIVAHIERQAERDTYAQLCGWRCPAGCKAGCARSRFRRQCAPSREDIETHLRESWLAVHPKPWDPGPGASLARRQRYQQLHADWSADMPCFELTDLDAMDVQQGFVCFWDGYCEPADWLYLRMQEGAPPELVDAQREERLIASGAPEGYTRRWPQKPWLRDASHGDEYCGEPSLKPPPRWDSCRGCHGCGRCWSNADRFGTDFHPVGAAACARRGCSGCCYCQSTWRYSPEDGCVRCFRESPPLPVYLEVRCFLHYYHHGPIYTGERFEHSGPWLTLDELRRHLTGLLTGDGPVPAYLLCRGAESVGDGRAICVAGDVRSHVPAAVLEEWTESLRRRGIEFQIGQGDARECIYDADQDMIMRSHVARAYFRRHRAETEWAKLEAESRQLQEQVEWEALIRHSCGERLYERGMRPAFRVGDIVYHPPPNSSTQHGVAVIEWVGRRASAERNEVTDACVRVPTGELRLLMWDTRRRCFDGRVLKTDIGGDRDWTLLPPCCGRGADCPQLTLALPGERQWPNGDPLVVSDIEPIPRAFLEWTREVVPPKQLAEHLKPFQRLCACCQPSSAADCMQVCEEGCEASDSEDNGDSSDSRASCSDSGEGSDSGSDSGDGGSDGGDGRSDSGESDHAASQLQYLEPWTWTPEREDPSDDDDAEVADAMPDPEELQTVQQWGGGDISEDSQASDPDVMSSLVELLAMLLRALWFVMWLIVQVIRGIYLIYRKR